MLPDSAFLIHYLLGLFHRYLFRFFHYDNKMVHISFDLFDHYENKDYLLEIIINRVIESSSSMGLLSCNMLN